MVIIKLTGEGEFYSVTEGIDVMGDETDIHVILEGVQVLANGEDITKKKGKYIKSKTYLMENYFIPNCGEEGPFGIKDYTDWRTFKNYFEIDVDPADFDPKKIHLIKSDYEIECIPYGIITDVIMYDGEKIRCLDEYDGEYEDEEEDGHWDNIYNYLYGMVDYREGLLDEGGFQIHWKD